MRMLSDGRMLLAALALALSCLLLPASVAYASAPHEAGGKAEQHFKVPEPATKADAVMLLNTSLEKIEQSLARSDFDAIHEATYSVEAALARIGKEPGYDGVSAFVAPRCEIVHLASEMQDAETLKAAVPILMKAAKEQFLITTVRE